MGDAGYNGCAKTEEKTNPGKSEFFY
jgi:hypothetical protein